MAYIESGAETSAACIFCAYPAETRERWRDRLVLAVARAGFVMMNRFPYNNGHILVVPRRHVGDPDHLPADEYQACAEMVRKATTLLRNAVGAQGLNVGMNLGRVAGAGIEHHCHWHIVPRWNGDTNFMPVVGEVKVMSEHLLATYDRLAPALAALTEP